MADISMGTREHTTPALRIRPGMDVYSADQSQYIGTVLEIWHGEKKPAPAEERGATGRQTGSSTESSIGASQPTDDQAMEPSGSTVDQEVRTPQDRSWPTWLVHPKQLGEEMGPFPTMSAGNTGPVEQSAEHEYATEPNGEEADVIRFAVRPGRLNLGPLTKPIYIPTSAVLSISMERIVLDVEKGQIPDTWRTK
jgi:hypothetical protein